MAVVPVPNGRQQLEEFMLSRARSDPSYAELLRRDPRSAVEVITGTTVPDDLNVIVVEETPHLMCIVIPTHPEGLEHAGAMSMTGGPRRKTAQKRTK